MKRKPLLLLAFFPAASLLLMMAGCSKGKRQDSTNKAMMEHTNNQEPLFAKGNPLPAEWFRGNAFLTPLIAKDKNNNFSAGSVTFEPGARTNWHTHPKGQVLIVTEGLGWYQEKGKSAQAIKKGDVVNIPENVEHWHGASSSEGMAHIAITNYEGDTQVTWLEPVTAQQYSSL